MDNDETVPPESIDTPTDPPAQPPVPPPPPTPATGSPGNDATLETRLASLETLVQGVSETLVGLLPKDKRPVKVPWTHWGSK